MQESQKILTDLALKKLQLSARIKEFRRQYNISQVSLADWLGVSRGTVAALESGRVAASAGSLQALWKLQLSRGIHAWLDTDPDLQGRVYAVWSDSISGKNFCQLFQDNQIALFFALTPEQAQAFADSPFMPRPFVDGEAPEALAKKLIHLRRKFEKQPPESRRVYAELHGEPPTLAQIRGAGEGEGE